MKLEAISKQLRPAILGMLLAFAFIYWQEQNQKEIINNCESTPVMMHFLTDQKFAYNAIFQDLNHNTFVLYTRMSDRGWIILSTSYNIRTCIIGIGYGWMWAIE